MKKIIFFLFALVVLVSACKTPQGARKVKLKNRSAEYVQKQLIQNQLDAEWFSAKAKIKYKDENRGMTVYSTLRLRKDSVIWMNAKAFGIEAGRVLIRPDSIFVLDRLNKRYMQKDIWWLQDEFGLPVNFAGLQAMLLGNPVFFHSDFTIEKDSTTYVLGGKNDRYEAAYRVDGLVFRLTEMLIQQPQEKRTGFLQLYDYETLETGETVSMRRNIGMNSPETGKSTVNIELSKVSINEPVSIPFSVPDRYTRN